MEPTSSFDRQEHDVEGGRVPRGIVQGICSFGCQDVQDHDPNGMVEISLEKEKGRSVRCTAEVVGQQGQTTVAPGDNPRFVRLSKSLDGRQRGC